jgi:hypothetical protein
MSVDHSKMIRRRRSKLDLSFAKGALAFVKGCVGIREARFVIREGCVVIREARFAIREGCVDVREARFVIREARFGIRADCVDIREASNVIPAVDSSTRQRQFYESGPYPTNLRLALRQQTCIMTVREFG